MEQNAITFEITQFFRNISLLCLNHAKAIFRHTMTKWWGTWVSIAISFHMIIKSYENKNNCKYRLWFHVKTLSLDFFYLSVTSFWKKKLDLYIWTRLNMLACRPAILSRASAKRLPYNLGVFITETVLDKLGADATETVLNFNIL